MNTSVPVFSACLLALSLLALQASPAQLNSGVFDVTSEELSPMPAAALIVRAQQAYLRGDIVRVTGGSSEDMKHLLGVNIAMPNATANSGMVIAVRKANGTMRQYVATLAGRNRSNSFEDWKAAQTTQVPQFGRQLGDNPSVSAAWTLIQQNTYSRAGDGGNTNYTLSIFRLNTKQTTYDYYMVVQDSNVVPNYYPPCNATLVGSCGWWTTFRTFSISAGAANKLFEYGPTGTITTETISFGIGANLSDAGPGVSASFGESWSQASVTTTDHSGGVTAAWREDFTGRFATTPPPPTSRGSFLSHQAAIFQVPFAQSFNLAINNLAEFIYLSTYNQYEYPPDDQSLQVNIPVNPPFLSLSPKSLTISPGMNNGRVASISAGIPGSYQGLSWAVTAQPSGLDISQTSGADSANLLLKIETGTPIGTTYTLNLQTDPPYGAPSVALNPVIMTVTVGSPPPLALRGVLFAGGISGGAPSSSAEVFDTASNSIASVGTLKTARAQHSATVLADGKVLIAGGLVVPLTGNILGTATAELFDPNTQIFTPVQGATTCPGVAGCMARARYDHSATLLPDGRVLIAGGTDMDDAATATAEIYDPKTQIFTLTGRMGISRVSHGAVWLPGEKKVLISGGYSQPAPNIREPLDTSEYFDPQTGQFSPGPKLPVPQSSPGVVSTGPCTFCLVAGLDGGGRPLNSFLTFSPATSTWSSAGALNAGRFQSAVTPLGNSGLLVTGGTVANSQGQSHVSATAEVNSLSSNTWGAWKYTGNTTACPGAAGCMVAARANHTSSVLPNGKVLLAGGQDDTGSSIATTEIFDPVSRTFSAGPALTLSRFWHSATEFHATGLATTAALESGQNPSVYGQPVTFTATVTSASGAVPTGSITFNDGANPLGTVQLTGGSAIFKAHSPVSGNHAIQAVYSGSGTFAASTSPVITQKVNMLAPSISVLSSSNPSAAGAPVTFTAHVSSSDGIPQGTVDFLDGSALLQTVALKDSEAAYSTSTLTAGPHVIVARYNGDTNFQGGLSPALNQGVLVPTQSTLASSTNPSVPFAGVIFTATVTSTGGTPIGGIDFILDSKTVAAGVGMRDGQAVYQATQLTAGNHTVTAVYRPGAGSLFSGSTSPTITQSVLNQTTTVVTSSANPASPGKSVNLQATVTAATGTATGTVDLLDGAAPLAIGVPLTNGRAVYATSALQPGSHSITAIYRPDANTGFAASTSSLLVQEIQNATTTIMASSLNPSITGHPVTLTATVTGSGGVLPAGTVTFTEAGAALGQVPLVSGKAVFGTLPLTQGIHILVASYSGSSSYAAGKSAPFIQTVDIATATVTLRSSRNPANEKQRVMFTATVTGPGTAAPTGTVVFLDETSHTLGSVPISRGAARYSTSTLTLGMHAITAAYQGDNNFSPTTSQPVNQVIQAAQCIPTSVSVTAAPSPSTLGQTVTFTAAVKSSDSSALAGSVTISETSGNNPPKIWGTANVSATGTALIPVEGIPLGTHLMYATYGGDGPGNRCGATSNSLDQTVAAPGNPTGT